MRENMKSLAIAVSIFTTLPVDSRVEWREERLAKVPFHLPLIGLMIGGLSVILLTMLGNLHLMPQSLGMIMTLYYILVTGGFHMDGLMDSCDAVFSRRGRERELEIMTDSRVGAFAVIGVIVFLGFKWTVLTEVLARDAALVPILVIPVISRTYQSLMLIRTPFAKSEGLAKMYGDSLDGKSGLGLIGLLVVLLAASLFWQIWQLAALLVAGLIAWWVYRRWTIGHYGGITGDLLGAYLELSELFLWMTLFAVEVML